MDTKWKKWKDRFSYIVVLFSIGSLLISGCTLALNLKRNYYRNGEVELQLRESDYQESRQFADWVSGFLEDFLRIANGTYVDWYTYYSNHESPMPYEAYAEENGWVTEEEYAQEETSSNVAEQREIELQREYEKQWEDYQNGANLTPEERDKMIRDYLNQIEIDQNLRYSIQKGNNVKYSNIEPEMLDKKTGNGLIYNYRLTFENGKVNIEKDGKNVDVYGDGVFHEDSMYCFPGYENYTVDVSLKDVKITILVAKTPLPFYKIGAKDNDRNRYGSGLYELYLTNQSEVKENKIALFFLAIGIVGVLLSILLRKSAVRQMKSVARLQVKLWFEVKLALLLLAIDVITDRVGMRYDYAWQVAEHQNVSSYLFDLVTSEEKVFILIYLILFLIITDLAINRKQFFEGLVTKFVRAFEAKSLRVPYAKRQMRRLVLYMAFNCVLLIVFAVVWCSNVRMHFQQLVIISIAVALLFVINSIRYSRSIKNIAEDMEHLDEQIDQIVEGNYQTDVSVYKSKDIEIVGNKLQNIQNGLKTAITEKTKSERMKVELVANVSHDIKTPLTSIISYIDLLKQEEELPEHVKDYITILDDKSKRLNEMVQDIFSVTKATSGQLPVKIERLDFGKLLNQTLADMEEKIELSEVRIKAEIEEHKYYIMADGQRLYRVCQNLIVNALKYSLPGSRVFISLDSCDNMRARALFRNTSKYELDQNIDFSERFVRGDDSRTDGGSGLGLSIAKSFTEACGGYFGIEINGDMFIVTVEFDQVQES